MAPHRVVLASVVLVGLMGTARAEADALVDHLGAREVSLGESMRAVASGGQAITLNPAGLSLNRELVFEGGYTYRPSDDASLASVSACDSTVPIPGCFYYKYFVSQPVISDMSLRHRAHEAGWVVARRLTPQVSLGWTGKYFDYNTTSMDEPSVEGFSFDVGVVVSATDSINLAAVGYNLWGEDSSHYPRGVGGGLSVRPSMRLAIAADAVWNLDAVESQSGGRYGGGVEYFLQSSDLQEGYPIRLGAVYDAGHSGTYITGGTGFLSRTIGVDIGARKQVDGGDELALVASLRFYGPRLPSDP